MKRAGYQLLASQQTRYQAALIHSAGRYQSMPTDVPVQGQPPSRLGADPDPAASSILEEVCLEGSCDRTLYREVPRTGSCSDSFCSRNLLTSSC